MAPKAKSPPPAPPAPGVAVRLGPYRGRLSVWETGVELEVQDQQRKTLAPEDVTGEVTITSVNGKPVDLTGTFSPHETENRAELNLAGARELQATLRLKVKGRAITAQVTWRLADDPVRRNDGLSL